MVPIVQDTPASTRQHHVPIADVPVNKLRRLEALVNCYSHLDENCGAEELLTAFLTAKYVTHDL